MNVDLKNKKGEIIYSCDVIHEERAVSQALNFAIQNKIDLSGLVVEDETLDDLNFSNMMLKEARFENCSLKRSTFNGGSFEGIQFVKSDMRHCIIKGNEEKYCEMTFKHVLLKGSKMEDINSSHLLLSDSDCSEMLFVNCNLPHLFAIDTLFEETVFLRSSLRNAFFSGGWKYKNPVLNVGFYGCDLTSANFQKYDLSSLHFQNANIQDALTKHQFLFFGYENSTFLFEARLNVIWFSNFKGSLSEFETEFNNDSEGFCHYESIIEDMIKELLPFLKNLINE